MPSVIKPHTHTAWSDHLNRNVLCAYFVYKCVYAVWICYAYSCFLFHFCVQMNRKTNNTLQNRIELKPLCMYIHIYRNLPLNGRSKPCILVYYCDGVGVRRRVCTFILRVKSMAPYSFHIMCTTYYNTLIKICPSTFCLCACRFPFRRCY